MGWVLLVFVSLMAVCWVVIWKQESAYVSPRSLTISDHFVHLPTHSDSRGHLTVAEKLPFPIKRVYYIYGVPPDAMRGGHAHKKVKRLIVPVSGSFKVHMFGEEVFMASERIGLIVPALTWLELTDFSPNTVCLILASEEHDESDCLRTKEEFEAYRVGT